MSVRIFEGATHANIYSRFRPVCPDRVIQEVLSYLKVKIDSNGWDIAVDTGCGSGQGTNQLSKYFNRCFGFDVSPEQIRAANEAKHLNNVEYYVSPAESLPTIQTNSVQLLTAFEAAHWFDFKRFFTESDRILVRNGVVALIGYFYPNPINPSDPEDNRLHQLMRNAYFDPRLDPFKNQRLELIERHYKDFVFPENYEFLLKDNIDDEVMVRAEDMVGYVQSWSLYQGLLANDRESGERFIQEFRKQIEDTLNVKDLMTKEIIFRFTYFIAMGRKLN